MADMVAALANALYATMALWTRQKVVVQEMREALTYVVTRGCKVGVQKVKLASAHMKILDYNYFMYILCHFLANLI
jgi:hypothetical protein